MAKETLTSKIFDNIAAPEVDGKHTITLDLSVMPGPLYSS